MSLNTTDAPTWQDVADHAEWQVQNGRAKYTIELDPLSIPCRWACQLLTVAFPVPGKHDAERKISLINAVLEE